MNRTLYIAAYDISDAARLHAALLVLKNHAGGGQKSVFECFLSRSERFSLLDEVAEVLDLREDRFLLLPLKTPATLRVLGRALPPSDDDFFYLG